MAFKIQDHIEGLSEDAKDYIESSVEYYKLDAYKKTAKATSALLKFFIISGIFLLFFAFLLIAIAIWLGELLDSMYLGFFIVAGVNLLLIIFFSSVGKKLIDGFVLRLFGEIFASIEDEVNKPD